MEVAVGGVDEGLRCEKISAGGKWKCNLLAMRGEVLCEKHYFSVHWRMRDGGGNSGEGGGGNSDVDYGGRKRKHDDEEMGVLPVDGSEIKVVFGENGVGGVRKRGRPKGSKNKEEKKVVEGNGGGVGSGKRGRPKGSKNRKKVGVGNEVEAMQVDPRGGGEILSMNNVDGVRVGTVSEAREVFDTVDVSVSKGGNFQGFHGAVLNENVTKDMGEGIAQEFKGLGSGGVMLAKDNGDRQPEVLKNTIEVSMITDNQEMLVHIYEGDSKVGDGTLKKTVNETERSDGLKVDASNGNAGTVDAPVLEIRRLGRPKGSKNKKKAINQTEKIIHIGGNVTRGYPGIIAAPMQKVRGRGRPKGSKNKKKTILSENSDGIDRDVSCVNSGLIPASMQLVRQRGRPKGSKNKKKTILSENSDGIDRDVSCVNSGLIPAPMQLVRQRGRPKGSKNKKKTIDVTEKRDGIECDGNGVVNHRGSRGRPKGYETRKKVLSVIKLTQRMRRHSANGGIKGGRGQSKGGYSWQKKSKDAMSIEIMQENQESIAIADYYDKGGEENAEVEVKNREKHTLSVEMNRDVPIVTDLGIMLYSKEENLVSVKDSGEVVAKKKPIARPRNNESYDLTSMGEKILNGNVERNNESCDFPCMGEIIPYDIARRNKSSALGMLVSFFLPSVLAYLIIMRQKHSA